MSLTITALLVDPEGKPLPDLEAHVCSFNTAGEARTIGAGRTSADGHLSIASTFRPDAGYQPRLQLRVSSGGGFIEVSEDARHFADNTCDFGRVTFNPNARLHLLQPAVIRDPSELEALRLQVAALEQTKLALEQQNAEMRAEQQKLIDEVTASYRVQLAEKDATIAAREAEMRILAERLDALERGEIPETSIQDLTQATAEQLLRAQAALRTQKAGLQLGNVALQLKHLPGRTAGRVVLPSAGDIERVGADALSMLQLEFRAEAPAPQLAETTVPRVIGYTEAMARRKLAESRLSAEIVYQFTTQDAEDGRVLSQTPGAQTTSAEGTVVVLAVGRRR